MHALRNRVSSWPVLSFFTLAVWFSWTYWLVLLARGEQVRPGSSVSHLPGLMGPMLAAIVVTWLGFGRGELRALFRSALTPPRPVLRNALLAVSPVGIGGAVFLGLAAAGSAFPSLEAFGMYPGLPVGVPLPLAFFAVLVLNGYGEEVGWRGFATRHLVRRLGKFKATLAVAAMWLVWHVPLFWLVANMQGLVGPALLGWAFGLLCGAFVLTGLYLTAGNSILVVAVWHTLYNFTVATPAGTGTAAALISTVVMAWGAYFALVWWRRARDESNA